jgi:hypothetical protein
MYRLDTAPDGANTYAATAILRHPDQRHLVLTYLVRSATKRGALDDAHGQALRVGAADGPWELQGLQVSALVLGAELGITDEDYVRVFAGFTDTNQSRHDVREVHV